ncbi:MAG: RNA polymerase sigma factor [Ginsengibacter sp.]
MTKNEQKKIFESWLDQYRGLVFKVVRAYALSHTDQNDLFQEITIQLWNSIPTFRQESSVSTWIYRISLNTAIKWVRKEQKHSRAESIENVEFIWEDGGTKVDERLAWLYEEIHRLDEIDRSLILLLLDGFSYKEMAGILGITESNVGVKINRVKKYLITKSKK